MSRNKYLLRYGRCSCDIYSRCSLWLSCISTQLSALRRSELVAVICLTHSLALNTPKSFRCPHSQKYRRLRSGNREGQLNGPPAFYPLFPEIPVQVLSENGQKTKSKDGWYTALLNLIDKETAPRRWLPKIRTQILNSPHISRHWFRDICWVGNFCSFKWVLCNLKACNPF
jgi:hypothetical protein